MKAPFSLSHLTRWPQFPDCQPLPDPFTRKSPPQPRSTQTLFQSKPQVRPYSQRAEESVCCSRALPPVGTGQT